MNIYAQCDFSEKAEQHWRRANAIIGDLKTSNSYDDAIEEYLELIVLAPDCPDVYYKLFVAYSNWAKIDNYDTYFRLNRAELFLKVCIAMNPENKEELKNQLAQLETRRERLGSNDKYEDFLDWAYDNLKTGNNKFAERFYQLHKFILKDNRRAGFERYFEMAYSAYSYYMKDEEEKAKAIYEEMLKIDFNDKYVRKMYDKCVYYIDDQKAILQSIFDNMVYIEGGRYEKQSVKSFYISRYEVTQKQWRAVMGVNPSGFWGCDDCPVENVESYSKEHFNTINSYIEDFLKRMEKETGKKYRLPTSAEWQYAWSGGKKSKKYKYSGSNNIDAVAWYKDNSENKTQPVGLKQPNELGLYDMTGNVSEICINEAGKYVGWGSNYKENPFRGDDIAFQKDGFRIEDYDTDNPLKIGRFKATGTTYFGRSKRGTTGESVGFRLVLDAEK